MGTRSAFKSSYSRLKKQRQRIYNIGLSTLLLSSMVLSVVNFQEAQAATTNLLPNSDVSVNWLMSSGSTAYSLVDEQPGSQSYLDYISTGINGAGGEVAEFGLDTADSVESVSNITVYISAQSATNANGGNLDTVSINLRISGALQSAITVTPAYSASNSGFTWYSASFSGSWNQTQLDGAQVHLLHNVAGGGKPADQDDDIRIATVYANVTYTQTVTFDQSSYRWFDNEDAGGGDGSFALPAESFPSGGDSIRAADFNNDGKLDIVNMVFENTELDIYLYDSSSRLSFERSVPAGNNANYVETADFNNDGNQDIVTVYDDGSTSSLDTMSILLGNGDGSFQPRVEYALTGKDPATVAVGDLNNDGHQDLVISRSFDNNYITVMLNSGNGSFGEPVDYNLGSSDTYPRAEAVIVEDFNNDSNMDVALGLGGPAKVFIYLGSGDGTLPPPTQVISSINEPYSLGTTDVNGDGFKEIVTVNEGIDQVSILSNDGLGGFSKTASYTTGDSPAALATGDLNSDGIADIVTINDISDNMSVLLSNSDGTFQAKVDYPTGDSPSSIDIADIGNDGVLDILVGNGLSDTVNAFYGNKRITSGSPLSVADTAMTAPSEGTPFRLRMSLHVGIAQAEPGTAFKLQYAERGADNICDTAFSGETYTDVAANTGVIRYYDDENASDGQSVAANVNDPTHGTDTTVLQTYEEGNDFTVANAIPAGQDGMWDFALMDHSTPANTTYCFRAVQSGGSLLNNYTVIPQLTSASPTLAQASYRGYENKDKTLDTFAKLWGGSNSDDSYGVKQANDGGYITTGSTQSFGAGGYDMVISKYDSAGDLSWTKTWGGIGTEYGISVAQTSDSGYVVTGYTNSFGVSGYDMFLAKYDASGSLLWSRTWGGTSDDYGYSAAATADKGVVVTGYTSSFGAGGADMFLAKYDASGNLSWSRTFGEAVTDYGRSVIQTTDKGFAVTGYTGGSNMFLAKYDASGNLSWSRTWGGANFDYGWSLVQTVDSGYAITGYTTSFSSGEPEMFLAKYDASGNLSWSRTWGGSGVDYGRAVIQSDDGGYVITGYTDSYGSGTNDMFITKFDSSGNHSWSRTFGGTAWDYGDSIAMTRDNGFIVAGNSENFNAAGTDRLLVKYNQSGYVANCGDSICRTISPTIATPTPTIATPTPTIATPTPTIATPTPTIATPSGSEIIIAGNMTFAKLSGGSFYTEAFDHKQLTDGSYVVTGYTDGYGAGDKDMYVTKYDPTGVVQWTRTWGGTADDRGVKLDVASDGSIFITGRTDSAGAGGTDAFIAKYSSTGSLAWFATWGGGGYDYGYGIAATSDGGAIITGTNSSYGSGLYDVYLAKYGTNGALEWSRTWGGSGSEDGNDIIETSDGGFMVTGTTTTFSTGSNDMFIARYDSAGTLLWSHTWGGSESDTGNSVIEASDGGYAVTGTTNSYGSGANDMFIAKYTSTGTLSWSRTFGGEKEDYSLDVVEKDSGYVITGYSTSGPTTAYMIPLVRFNESGSLEWNRLMGGGVGEFGRSVLATDDGGYSVAGSTAGFGATYTDMLLIKYDTYGDIRNCGSSCDSPIMRVSVPSASTTTPSTVSTTSPFVASTDPGFSSTSQSITNNNAIAPQLAPSVDAGTTLGQNNTQIELLETDSKYRLRIGLVIQRKPLQSVGTLKLQVGLHAGTCESNTVAYSDVSSSSSPIAFYDNPTASTGDIVHPDTNDPTYSSSRNILQTYVESNSFSNARQMAANDLSIWDFALKADGSKIGRTYCFRIVETGNSLTGGYEQYAQVYIPPTMTNVMRHGTFFNTQGKMQPFAWGRE